MHVLATQLAGLEEADVAVDLGQSPADVVVLSFSDTDLSALAAAWQRQVSALMGIQGPTTLGYLRTLIVAVAVGALVVSTFRVLIDAVKLLARMLIRRWHLHDEVALFIGTTIVVALLLGPTALLVETSREVIRPGVSIALIGGIVGVLVEGAFGTQASGADGTRQRAL